MVSASSAIQDSSVIDDKDNESLIEYLDINKDGIEDIRLRLFQKGGKYYYYYFLGEDTNVKFEPLLQIIAVEDPVPSMPALSQDLRYEDGYFIEEIEEYLPNGELSHYTVELYKLEDTFAGPLLELEVLFGLSEPFDLQEYLATFSEKDICEVLYSNLEDGDKINWDKGRELIVNGCFNHYGKPHASGASITLDNGVKVTITDVEHEEFFEAVDLCGDKCKYVQGVVE